MGHQVQRVTLHAQQPVAYLARIGLPRRREGHAMARAPEQRHADELFQRHHLPRDCPLSQCQLLCSACIALVASGSLKAGQGLGGGNRASHRAAIREFSGPAMVPQRPSFDKQEMQEAHIWMQTNRLRTSCPILTMHSMAVKTCTNACTATQQQRHPRSTTCPTSNGKTLSTWTNS